MELFFKILTRTLIVLAVVVVMLLVAEVIVNHHDRANSYWTRRNSVQEPGGPAVRGLNRREFNDIRFRSRDMSLYIAVKRVGAQEALMIPDSVSGKVAMTLNGNDFCKFDFKLAESQVFNLTSGHATKSGLFDDDPKDALVEFDKRVDRDYLLVPVGMVDESEHLKFKEHVFGVKDKLLLDITIDGPVPRTAVFMFVYCRSPKSVLAGTFMEPLGNMALSWFPKNIFGK